MSSIRKMIKTCNRDRERRLEKTLIIASFFEGVENGTG